MAPRRRLLACLFAAAATAVAAADPGPVPAAPQPLVFDLHTCLRTAVHGHPRVMAHRASLASAEDAARGLDALCGPAVALLSPDLPVRRKQAALGLTAAAAALDEAERETVYAVTRAYFTVVFAREQEKVAKGVVDRLKSLKDAAQKQLDAGARDATAADVGRTGVYVRLAETKRIEATQGVRRALAALREAVGLPPGVWLDVPDAKLPTPAARPSLPEVVAATCRRGDLIRAGVFADVAGLEVSAQFASLAKRLDTFAVGSDIHSTAVPQAVRGFDYRPGGIPPEMPALLAGPRPERVRRADTLRARAVAVVDGTRSLLALEAEDAFLRWEQAALQAAETKAAADDADKTADELTSDYVQGAKVKVEEVAQAGVLASQTRAQANEYLYRQIVALAELERITAGAFCAHLATRPVVVTPIYRP